MAFSFRDEPDVRRIATEEAGRVASEIGNKRERAAGGHSIPGLSYAPVRKETGLWAFSYAAGTATFKRCCYMRLILKHLADQTLDLSGADTTKDLWVGVSINTVSGDVTMLQGADESDVSDSEIPSVQAVRRPLYLLTWTETLWAVKENWVFAVVAGIYV